MTDAVKRTARAAESSAALRATARAGYAANGVVHLLIGVIVLAVVFGGRGETDQTGALKAIAAAPLGFAAVWLVAVALCGLGLWHVVEGILASRAGAARTWSERIGEWGQAVVFVALGAIAASVALGARPDADEAAADAGRGVLALPGGPWVLALVGIGIGIGGVAFVWMGLRRSFEKKIAVPRGALGAFVRGLGTFGFVAKGLALAIVAVLLVVAAVTVDPSATGGLDAAIDALLELPYGPWLGAGVGVGLIAYGVFCFFRAGYARLDA